MFMRLFGLMSGRAWLIALAVAAVGGGWLWYEAQTARLESALVEIQAERDTLRQGLDAWQARADRYREDLAAERAEQARAEQAVRELQAQLAGFDARYRVLQARIRQAPESDNGAVAPVLRDALEALP